MPKIICDVYVSSGQHLVWLVDSSLGKWLYIVKCVSNTIFLSNIL